MNDDKEPNRENKAEDLKRLNREQLKVNVLLAIEHYQRQKSKNIQPFTFEIEARLRSLFELCRFDMKNTEDEQDLEVLESQIESKDINDLTEAFRYLSDWIDEQSIKDPVIL